jgi:hypothetical protein
MGFFSETPQAGRVVAIRGLKDDKQSAHFGSTGEDFALVRLLP